MSRYRSVHFNSDPSFPNRAKLVGDGIPTPADTVNAPSQDLTTCVPDDTTTVPQAKTASLAFSCDVAYYERLD